METRAGLDIARAAEAYRIPLGTTYERLTLISVQHAQALVNERREIKKQDEELGCWTSKLASDQKETYANVNLQNTYSHVPGKGHLKINLKKAYLHHLAIIGKDDLERLSWCTQENSIFQVSHLCHNPRCFNPDHLVVEESARNRARNICQHHEVVKFAGFSYHPCPHDAGGVHPKCILPTRRFDAPGAYSNSHSNI